MNPDYGIDAPGVRRGMLAAGVAGTAVAALALILLQRTSGPTSTMAAVIGSIAGMTAVYGLGMAAFMTYGSKVGKLRARERLLDLAQSVVPWTGQEAVLDVGCGRGLMLVGAARRLTSGKAVGVDVWRPEDQADNSPDAALENARLEGVVDRVIVVTGDARKLPFDDCCFDAVLSHWVVHNLPNPGDRARAVGEMVRVLKPGGVLVLADIAHHADYRRQLEDRGMTDIRTVTGGLGSWIIGVLSYGSFRPQTVAGRRP